MADRLTAEREAECRRYALMMPGTHVADLIAELDAVRAELAALRGEKARMSAAIHNIGVAALNWNSATKVTDVLDAVDAARKAIEG